MAETDPAGEPGRLVFRPDPRKVRRLKLVRRLMGLAALLIVTGAVLFVLAYRPRIDFGPEDMPPPRSGAEPVPSPAGSPETGLPPTALPAPPEPPRTPAGEARRLAGRVGDRAGRIIQYWARLGEALPADLVSPAGAAAVREELGKARALLDSASATLGQLRADADSLEAVGRQLETGRRYDLSVLQAALNDALGDFRAQQREFAGMLDNAILAVDAVLSGDGNGAVLKSEVASGYRARTVSRSRVIARRREALTTAVRRLGGWSQ